MPLRHKPPEENFTAFAYWIEGPTELFHGTGDRLPTEGVVVISLR